MPYRQPADATHTEPYFEYDPATLLVMKPLEEEILAELRLIGVEAVALRLLRRRFPNRREGPLTRLATQIASCVRQAEEYFWLAVEAPSRIAPLLHYYSMLNLAKALIYLESPQKLARPGDFGHGLTDPHRIKDPDDYSVLTETVKTTRGIFTSLYAVLTGAELPQRVEYRLAHLMQYCTWITHELGEAFGVDARLLTGQLRLRADSNRGVAWLTVELPREAVTDWCGTISQFRADAPAFFRIFHRVASPSETLAFECDPVAFSGPRSTQSVLASLRRRVRELRLYRHLLAPESTDATDYLLPLQLYGADALPEPCVLYAITFYLGSLVRYQPHIYDATLGREEAWLVDAFIRQCPICFSHIMLNHLWRAEHVFHRP